MVKKVTFLLGATLFFAVLLIPSRMDALEITPAIREITLKPGEEKTAMIDVTNDMPQAVEVTAKAVNFTPKDETSGEPLYNITGTPTDIATWMTITESTFTLQKDETQAVAVTFAVPATAKAGGHYAGVVFNFGEKQVAGQVTIQSSVGIPFLATVTGDYTESAEIAKFATKDEKSTYTSGPIVFDPILIENTGDVHLKPMGTVMITNMFGKTVKTFKINEDQSAVLPGYSREYAVGTWKDLGNAFGSYTAKVTITAGTVTETASANFMVISTMGIVIIAVVLVVLIVVAILLMRKGDARTKAPEVSAK
ncbi:MAG: hypothetical protein PHY34_00745 [Patescibacteria group bacterium]|nr:hypothetical protein [Patescibacteria group bacterium]MDD5715843.1 hypothetical protein [Patescibacteria group bacterium]